MGNLIKHLIYILFCIPLFGLSEPAPNKDEVKALKIAFAEENSPLSMALPDGTPTGLHIEIWKLWSKTNNIPVTFISQSLVDNIKTLKNLEVDFHAGLFKNAERSKWANFSLPIHRLETGVFFYNQYGPTTTLHELHGKKVGVHAGSFQADYLIKQFPQLNIIQYVHSKDIVRALLDKKLDALVAEIPYVRAELGKMGLAGVLTLSEQVLLTNEIRALVPKGNTELVERINKGIRNIPISQLIALEKRWLPGTTPYFSKKSFESIATLTLEQINWLKSNKIFKLGVDPFWEPFDFIDSAGKHAGISSDYIQLLESKLNVEMRLVEDLSWAQVIQQTKEGKIDILPAVTITEDRKQFLSFSTPYLSFPMVIVTRNDAQFIQQLDELKNRIVGVVKSSPTVELISKQQPDIKLNLFDTTKEGLIELNEGKIDAFVQNLGVVTHQINTNNFSELKVAAILPDKFEVAIGVRKNLTEFIPIINKTLSTITSKKRAAITNNWLALQVNVGTDIKTILMWVIPLGTGLMFIILFFVRSNRRLQYEITEKKRVEISLEKAREVSEATSKAKGEFLANMSHEIRTPMNAVVGMARLLKDSGLNEEQRDYINILNHSASSLLVLIDDILDLSKVEAGQINLENAEFSVETVVENVCTQVSFGLDTDNIRLIHSVSQLIPPVLLGDSVRLGQILLNLTNNAVKFTETGEIRLGVKAIEKSSDKVTLQFSVSDSGIGMTDEQLKHIFETYSQADSSITRKFGGTGLGLAISKRLCNAMGGDIWATSTPDQGSEFNFTVRLNYLHKNSMKNTHKTRSVSKEINRHQNLRDKHILIVDDNEINLMISQKILAKFGVEIELARNGREAITKLEDKHFDIILMDIQMPIMDGYSATREIRCNPKFKDLPIIAMSANVLPQDIEKILEVGMNAHIGKPLKLDLMLDTIIAHINKTNLS